jgi:glucose-6-phosphate isomerase
MTESAPIDPTATAAWKTLSGIADGFTPDLRGWFAADPGRAGTYTFQAADLTVDLSKNLVTEEILGQLLQLARDADVAGRYRAMISGEHINVTEDRAVLHTALRRPDGGNQTGEGLEPAAGFVVDGADIDAEVHGTLDKVYAFADRVRSGEWTGVTGKRIQTVVNIGIGGSDLGPVMVYEALKPYVQEGLEVRFVSNIDPSDIYEKTAGLDPETTLFIVASKTFGTLETLTNAPGPPVAVGAARRIRSHRHCRDS